MNKIQINKSRMYGTVDLVLEKHVALMEPYPELILAHQQLKKEMALIGINRQVQEADLTGLTATKMVAKGDLITEVLKFSAALRAYATVTKNEDLKAKAHYVPSDLKRKPDQILFDIGTLVFGLAQALKTELMKYAVGEAEINEMEKLLAKFKSLYPLQRVAYTESKVSTGNIGHVCRSIDKLLKEGIDEMMLPFQYSQPDFYNSYRHARMIVNYSGRHKTKQTASLNPV